MYADVLRQVESVVDADPGAGLLARIADGDRTAMEHLYRRSEVTVYRFALTALQDPIAAADVLQAVMIRAWIHARDYAGGDLMVWLLAFAGRETVLRLPSEERDFAAAARIVAAVARGGGGMGSPDPAEDVQRVRAALAELPPGQRLALHLAFAEDMPYEDIADVLDCPEATARELILAGRRSLKRLLGH